MCEGLDEWRGATLTCDHAGRLDGAMGIEAGTTTRHISGYCLSTLYVNVLNKLYNVFCGGGCGVKLQLLNAKGKVWINAEPHSPSSNDSDDTVLIHTVHGAS
jgi:hypothetical protein